MKKPREPFDWSTIQDPQARAEGKSCAQDAARQARERVPLRPEPRTPAVDEQMRHRVGCRLAKGFAIIRGGDI